VPGGLQLHDAGLLLVHDALELLGGLPGVVDLVDRQLAADRLLLARHDPGERPVRPHERLSGDAGAPPLGAGGVGGLGDVANLLAHEVELLGELEVPALLGGLEVRLGELVPLFGQVVERGRHADRLNLVELCGRHVALELV
jgi:hypothetical protein